MRSTENAERLDASEPNWGNQSQDGGVGPQGEALILELQRLRQAFNEDDGSDQRRGRSSRHDDGAEPDRYRRGKGAKRRRKGRMGRAIDSWLTQFGLKAPAQDRDERPFGAPPPDPPRRRAKAVPGEPVVMKRSSETKRQPDANARQRRRGPTVISGEPISAKRPVDPVSEYAPRRPERRQAPPIIRAEPVVVRPRSNDARPNDTRPSEARPGGTRPVDVRPVDAHAPRPLRPQPPPSVPSDPRAAKRPVEPTIATPPRRDEPTITHGDRIAMDLMKPAPAIPMPGNSPQRGILPAPPGAPLPVPAKPETGGGTLISRSRSGLMTGVSFILDHGAPPPPDDESLPVRARWSFERELRRGLRVLLVALVLGGGWMVFVPLAGAVVVPGNLVVQSNVKAIQHPTGGVVAEINVQNGSHVQAGDLLVKLDATQAQAALQVVSKQLAEVRSKLGRLTAERDGLDHFDVPSSLASRASEDNVASALAAEQSLFKARYTGRQGQKDLLQSKVSQLTEEIGGLEAQVSSKAKQLELIQGELTGVQDLYDKRLVPLTRLTSLQREAARLDGERGQLDSTIAETKAKIGEAQLQILRTDQDFRTDVMKELTEAQAKEAELVERGVTAKDQLDRIELRSPISGLIHQLNVHTIGGVIRAGDTVMEIVPDSDDLQIEAHVQPNDIDQVHNGQTAFVRLTAFDRQTTPQLSGTVSYVSADTSREQQSSTNTPFFTVRVVLPEEERRKLAGGRLVPGMPAEVFMQTGSRSMMSYLFRPILDQMRRSFVER
jgi:membrane fusion protein, type I secretion system